MSHVEELFVLPGEALAKALRLRESAAQAHRSLLAWAIEARANDNVQLIGGLLARLSTGEQRRLLCHPVLIQGLHQLSGHCRALSQWHERVAPPLARLTPVEAILGDTALNLLVRAGADRRGAIPLAADNFGRLHFPLCHWSLSLSGSTGALAGQVVHAVVGDEELSFHLAGEQAPFLRMARSAVRQMLAEDRDTLDVGDVRVTGRCKARFERSAEVQGTRVRYEPIAFADAAAHAGSTGGLIEALLLAIGRNAAGIHREFGVLMHTVRGFELPPEPFGVVQSFSDPTTPGIMGFNVNYTADGDLRLDPFCFTWLGHELGHTRNYLIDNVLFAAGETLLLNQDESAGFVPRYQRPITVRTLFQIPYVHLYEWALLQRFAANDFAGLAWAIEADWHAQGDDLSAEISEAFERIADCARLSEAGRDALERVRRLHGVLAERWQRLRLVPSRQIW